MNYLLDTHLLLWAASDSAKLSSAASDVIGNTNNSLWVSIGSFWEVAIKRSKLGRGFPFEVGQLRAGLLANGYKELMIEARHTLAVQDLPRHHTDPFDRLFVAQAISEGMILLTADKALFGYGPSVQLV